MVQIYVLRLEKGKYYVGKTNNLEFRLQDHLDGNGSAWTSKYPPIDLVELIPNCDDYDEDKYTLRYMDKYGIDNVRGGSFVSIELDESTKQHIEKMNQGANNKCYSCGQSGHFIKYCPNKSKSKCERCGRDHPTSKCYAKTHINGTSINNKCERCGGKDHSRSDCYEEHDINGKLIKDCLRCGRDHATSKCYAKTDICGDKIKDKKKRDDPPCTYCNTKGHTWDNCTKYIEIQRKELERSNHTCIKCEIKGHYESDCPCCTYCHKNGHMLYNCPKYLEEMQIAAQIARDNNICSRCEKKGHYRLHCYETTDVRGRTIDDFCVIS